MDIQYDLAAPVQEGQCVSLQEAPAIPAFGQAEQAEGAYVDRPKLYRSLQSKHSA